MSYLANDITAPSIQIDSVAIGFQLNGESEAKNINSLDLNKDEFLVVGEKTYIPGDTSNTKWSLVVNSQGTSVNASRSLARQSLTPDTSLYVDKNIHCSGIIKAAGLELNNIRIDNTTTITSNLIRDFIVKTNDLVVSQPFQTGYITNYNNLYNINYDVKNVYTPNFVTFGGHIDTYKNTHPLNIVTTPNNKFNNMHVSIRNDTNNDEEPSRMCIGMIGGSNISPAIISTTRGVPLEFHVSTSSENIDAAYNTRALPIYNSNNVPAMTIDANNNVGIGTNNTSLKNYYKKVFTNNSTTNVERFGKPKFEVKGLSTFDDILLHDYQTNTYKHLDDIYIRSTGISVLNATQIKGGDFTDTDSLYRFKNNLTVSKLLSAGDANIDNSVTIGCNLTTDFLNVNEHSIFDGTVAFNNDVNFDSVQNININNLNINNDLFINNKRVTALDTTDTFTGNFEKSIVDGSNYIFIYVSSNIASLDANCNVNFPNKLGIGLSPTDGFDGVLNIIKNDKTTSNNFDISLKNTSGNKTYIANIGRLSRLDYNDNSLIFNTNKVPGKNNNIYFYPSSDMSILTSNRFLPNLRNTPPTLSLLNGKVGINKLNPDNLFALDIGGKIAANDYYVSQDNNFKRTKNFVYNNGKNFFNLYDTSTDKFCINYNELISFASDMRGLNVKKGINADLYYQNNILLETLQKASSTDSFYTNKNISIGWKGEANVTPLQVRNLYTNDYNYSTIRIYRGVRGGGLFNNADYSGIDICEYDRDINQDRNKEKWFIYKNHKYNDLDARDYMRIGPLQIGYTNKTIEPTSYGMSFYYDPLSSKYHIDVNNPKVSYDDKSAMTIYGDLNVHGNVNILDNEGCNFNFTMKALSSNLQKVDRYINYISGSGIDTGYSTSANKIAMSIDILRPKENIIIDPVENAKIPVIIKNMNDDNPATKFITYSKSNICYSMIELAIYNSNLQLVDDVIDKQNNIRNAIQMSVANNNSNTYLDFNVYNNDSYKNFLRFINTVSDNGDANSTIAHMGLGTDKSSNILFHIDGNEKYGLQITNNKFPASINLLNSEGKNIYHTISGGDLHNNHKFTIDVSAAAANEINNEPVMTNVFTIDAFQYNGDKRRGARYGFNEDFSSNINQTFVIKSDYDTVPMSITSRYSYEYMFNSTVKIDYSDVLFDILSSNWNNDSKTYFSFYKQNITKLPATDANDNVIDVNNIDDEGFIFKTNNLISTNLSYITVHSNINYPYFFSNLDINYMPLNNQTFDIKTDSVKDKCDLFKENDFSLVPQGIFYSSNDNIKPSDISEKMLAVNDRAVFNIYDSNILFNYEYINRYIISSHISCNISIIVSSNIQRINNSNYFNISNYITTTLGTVTDPFNALENVTEHTYIDYHQNFINLNEKFLEYSNIFLNTYTTNILKYNSNIAYDAVFFSVHTNHLNIATSNVIFDELFELNTAYLDITSNIEDNNYIVFRTSNYSINNNANAMQRNMVIQQFSSNVFEDTFDILGNTINKTLIIEEYFNNYCNYNLEDINIGIRNYNYKNYKPHISLINDVEKNDSVFEGHEIYSYDGVFEIKYANSTNKQFVPLKIDSIGNMTINGGLDTKGNIKIDGNIFDANGNNLIEILNKNYYKEYEINSSNIYFNSFGSNGIEINARAMDYNHIDYNFFYVKDYLSTDLHNDILVLHKSELLNNTYNLDLYADLYINCNLYIEGEGNNPSLSVFQKHNTNIIRAANLDREVLTLAYDGSMGLGITEPQGVLLNARQNNIGSNVISASNMDRELLTLAYDGSMGLGITEPQGVLLNARQNNIGSNIISASNIEREVLTVAYDGSIGFGVMLPQGVLLNARQNNIGSNIISASNIEREVLTVAYDGSIGFGVTQPQGVLLNARQNNVGSNIISASNIEREVLTVAYDGSIGFGVTQPQGVLLNARQNNIGSNIISASNIEREVLTVAYDGSIGFGVTRPQGVLLNARQNNVGSNIISASNIEREVLTVAYDGSIGFGVTRPQGVLLNARQNNVGSNIISASNIEREVLTVAYDGSIGFGVTRPQGVLLNARQNNVGSNIISASNINREVLTVAYDGSIGFGVTRPQGVLLNARQNNIDSNIISASNIEREVLTVAYDGSIGFGVTRPQGVLLNARQNNIDSNIISASNIEREVLTVAYDGSIGFGVTRPQGVLLNARQNNVSSNIISASNIEREVLTVAYDGSIGFGVTRPQGVLLNARQNNVGSNIISASNINREVLTVAYDGSIGFGVTRPQGVLLNARQNNIGSNIISASNIEREVLTVAYDGSIGFGVTQPQGVLLNARQNNIGRNIISASNIEREVLTVAYDGSIGFGVTRPQGVLLNARQNNIGSNIISASNIEREVLTVAYDGSIGFGVTRPQGVLLNARQNNIDSNIISASNINREVLTVAYDGSIGFGVTQPQGVLLNARQNNIGSNIISASNINREVLTVAYDGSIGIGVVQPQGVLLNARQNNIGSNIISASNINREVLTVAYDGSIGFGVTRPQGVLLNARQNNVGSNIISASNINREVLTVAYDGSIGFGVTQPQGVLLNARQNNIGKNIISASNIEREVLTVAYDGSIGFGVIDPQGVLLNARQNNIGNNIISASNINREVLTVAYDGSIGFGVIDPQGVLLNARQNNIGRNIISASNINREVLTVAYDGSIGFGVTRPQGVLLNARQNNIGSNIISASNIDREVLTIAYDGSIGFGVTRPQGVLLNARQNNIGSNIISASNIDREVLTVAYDGSIGFGVTRPQGVLLNARQNNIGSNIISASNINREVLTVAYDGSIGLGITRPQGVLLNARQNNIGSNIIAASNLDREVLTVAYDGSIGFGVGQPQGVLLNARQNNIGKNIISASNLDREVLTVAYDGSIGFGVTQPQSVLLNARQNNIGRNIISASNLDREVMTVAYDGSIGFGVMRPQGVLLNARQNNIGSNIISASNINREVLTVAYDGSIGFGVTRPQGVLLNARQNNIDKNIISASNIDSEVLTVAYDGSIGLGVTQPQGILLNARQNNIGKHIISVSNINSEVFTVAYDGSMGLGVVQPRGILLNARQNNVGSNIISASNINREVLTVAYDGSIGFGVSRPQGVLLNARQNNIDSNIISASNINREVLTVAYDGSIGFGVMRPQGVLLNARQNNIGSNIISASNISREVFTVAYDGSIGFGVVQPQGVLLNARQNNIGSNIISASNINREVLTVAYDGSIGFGVMRPQGVLLNARQNNVGSNIISASNINREVLTVAYDGSIGFGVTQPRGILLNARQNNVDNNIISASNIDSEVLTLAYDGSMGLGVMRPQGVLLNARQNNIGYNIISASNLNREVLTLAYDGSMGLGVMQPQGVLLNARQNNIGYNIISASNINREVLTVAYDGSMGFGVTRPQGVLLNARQNNLGSNIISASNIDREVLTVAYDGSIGFGVTRPQGVLLNARQNNLGSNIISASNINREVLTVAYDGSIGFGVTRPQGVLLNARQNNLGSNIMSASNINREVMTLTYDGIMGLGVTNPNKQSLLDVQGNINIVSDQGSNFIYTINNRDIIKETSNYILVTSNFIANRITNLTTDFITENVTSINKFIVNNKYKNDLFIDGDLTINSNLIVHGVTTTLNTDVYTTEQLNITNTGQGDALIVKQINNSYNIFTASNNNIPVFNINYNGKVGIGTETPKVYLEINSTDGIKIPSGTDIQRPSGINLIKGTIRYNTNTNQFEGYGAGNHWGTLGGVKDVNNDTFISAESYPGSNNDELRFITSNIEKMIIKTDGKVGIGRQNPEYLLDVQGDIRTNSNLFVNFNVGIGTTNISSSLLNIYGKAANIKIQNPHINNPVSSIDFINGINNSIQSNTLFGWRMSNSNNSFVISSGKNNIINDCLIIDGGTGNIGIGTKSHIELDNNGDTYKININGSINIEGEIYKQGVLFTQGINGGGGVGVISQNMPIQTLSKTYKQTKSYLESGLDNDGGWKFIDENVNSGFLIKIKSSHRTSKILLNLSMHIGIDSAPESIWWGLRLYRKMVDNNQNIITDWHEVVASRPENNPDNATPCWLSHTLGANLTSYENFVANINGTFFDTPDSRYNVYYTVKWKTNLGNNYGGSANIYLNRPAKYNSNNSSVLSSTWTATEIWQLGTPYIPSEGSNIITIYNQDFVGIGNTQPQHTLDIAGDINITGAYKINNEIFRESQWTTNSDNNIYYNNYIGVGTVKPDCLLALSGANAKIKIHDDGINNDGSASTQLSTSIELINGSSNLMQYNLNKCGWRMSNSNNNYIISSGSNSIINDRFVIDSTGNIGVGTVPNHKLDIDGIINAKAFNLNGSPFVLEFTQGMTIQTIHKTYSKTVEKELNSIGWVPIDIQNDGFYVKIKPSHIQSKVLVSMTCHIGMDYAEDSRWWGLQLYRKIGSGSWVPINDANGTNGGGLECSPCWISHNLGADNSTYSHSIINVSGSYEDMPNTEEDVYYTAYWKSKLDNTIGKLYINRPAYVNNSNYPLTSSSWTASEIWNNGTPYKPITTTIAIAYDKVGIGMTPSESSEYKLEVAGNLKCANLQCVSVTQTSDARYKKNIENIENALDDINKLNPVSYLLLNQESSDKKSYGFIAQELKNIFPEVVVDPNTDNELYSINYTSIIPLLTKSIQELTKKIELQQNEINYLKQKL
jgi:hypothetical protein